MEAVKRGKSLIIPQNDHILYLLVLETMIKEE